LHRRHGHGTPVHFIRIRILVLSIGDASASAE
jgi:hypothetical protein